MYKPTLEQTIAALTSIGFVPVDNDDPRFMNHESYFESESDIHYGIPCQGYIYDSNAGYCCVELDGGYKAPCSNEEEARELLQWLETHYIKKEK